MGKDSREGSRVNWIKRIWNDTVWSQVIAWSITGIIAVIVLALLPSVQAWLFERLDGISRLQVVGWFVLGVTLGGSLGFWLRYHFGPQSVQVNITTVPAPLKDKAIEDMPVAKGFKPTDEQGRVLMTMLLRYPNEIDLAEAHNASQTATPAHAERQMELLGAAHVVRVRRMNENATYYRLTLAGRDYATAWIDEVIG